MKVTRPMILNSSRREFLSKMFGAGAYLFLGAHGLFVPSFIAAAKRKDRAELNHGETENQDIFSELPYRQDDPRWKDDLMWDRDLVIEAHTKLNRRPQNESEELLREFEDGNTIGNEGCMLTCLAMVLQLLAPSENEVWTPGLLNSKAQQLNYYTPAGISMAPLFADIISELTTGNVQLCAKEEYLAGEATWPRTYVQTSALVRAYRSLPVKKRRDFVVMLKTGTYDDTIASHYVLLRPDRFESPDLADPEILDPAQPLHESGTWRLSDSAQRICADPDIRRALRENGIDELQIGGAWIFARWRSSQDRLLMGPLIGAWAKELAKP